MQEISHTAYGNNMSVRRGLSRTIRTAGESLEFFGLFIDIREVQRWTSDGASTCPRWMNVLPDLKLIILSRTHSVRALLSYT